MPDNKNESEKPSTAIPAPGNEEKKQEKEPISGDAWTVKLMKDTVYFLLAVLFIGFAGMFVATTSMLIDSFKAKQGSYEALMEKLDKSSNCNSLNQISK